MMWRLAFLHGVLAEPQVPPLHRYYQDAPNPCCSFRVTSFPSLGDTTWACGSFRLFHRHCMPDGGPGVGHPVSPAGKFCRGNNRASQVPGEPQYPSAHVLRPRSDNMPL